MHSCVLYLDMYNKRQRSVGDNCLDNKNSNIPVDKTLSVQILICFLY